MIRYLGNLSNGRLILWCYFVWYVVVLVRYFDSSLRLWLTSLGLSLIIGFALFISTTAASANKVKLDFWQTFRLFLMPFCVSSFAALVKARGGRVLLECPPRLKALLATCVGVDEVVGEGETLPDFDVQVPLMHVLFDRVQEH